MKTGKHNIKHYLERKMTRLKPRLKWNKLIQDNNNDCIRIIADKNCKVPTLKKLKLK